MTWYCIVTFRSLEEFQKNVAGIVNWHFWHPVFIKYENVLEYKTYLVKKGIEFHEH